MNIEDPGENDSVVGVDDVRAMPISCSSISDRASTSVGMSFGICRLPRPSPLMVGSMKGGEGSGFLSLDAVVDDPASDRYPLLLDASSTIVDAKESARLL